MFKRIFTRAAALLLSLSFLSCGYVHAEDGQAGNIKGLQEAGEAHGDKLISGDDFDGTPPSSLVYMNRITDAAMEEAQEFIIDSTYESDTVSRSCTVRELTHDLTIDAGDREIVVILDDLKLDDTISVRADGGNVSFYIKGDIVIGGNSNGIIWHQLTNNYIVTYDMSLPMYFYSAEDAQAELNGKAVMCGNFYTPELTVIMNSKGNYEIEYISEYYPEYDSIIRAKPVIIGSALFKAVKGENQDFFLVFCGGNAVQSDEKKMLKYGDANDDGLMDMSDVVAVMQSLANPDKYALSEQGALNADMNGDGVTVNDALAIQKHLLMLD